MTKSLTAQEYTALLQDSPAGPNAKALPVTFPVNFLGPEHAYRAVGLFEYVSLQTADALPSGFYFETHSSVAYVRRCSAHCASCESFSKCFECEAGYFLRAAACFACTEYAGSQNPNYTACPQVVSALNCAPGQFHDKSSDRCADCPAECTRCESTSLCTDCHSLYELDSVSCVALDRAPLPLEGTSASTLRAACTDRPENCLFCDQAGNGCRICDPGYFVASSQCKACGAKCTICADSQTCLRCDFGFFLRDGQCSENTVLNAPFALSKPERLKPQNKPGASASRKTAIPAIESSDSSSCSFGFQSQPGKCFLCRPGWFLAADSECRECSANCRHCRDSRICLKCRAQFELWFDRVSKSTLCRPKKVSTS